MTAHVIRRGGLTTPQIAFLAGLMEESLKRDIAEAGARQKEHAAAMARYAKGDMPRRLPEGKH